MKRPKVRLRTLVVLIAVFAVGLGIITERRKALLREEQRRAEAFMALAEAMTFQAQLVAQQYENEQLKQQIQRLSAPGAAPSQAPAGEGKPPDQPQKNEPPDRLP